MPDETPVAPTRPRRGTTKHPMDYTGREDERLKAVHADEVEQAAEQMAMATGVTVVRPKRGKVHDYSAEARPKPQPFNQPVPEETNQKYQVRILADIDQMTFGREIVEPPDFTDPMNPRPGIVGPLLVFNFKEGEEYIVDKPVYERLVQLGYVYGAD
jgi:hypothetical protein